MNLRFLGVGGAFDPEFGSSSAIVETGDGTALLIDCGCTTYGDLKRSGRIDDITHVLITHLHDDHVGSLGSFLFHRYHVSRNPAQLLFPPALRRGLSALLAEQMTHGSIEEIVPLRQLDWDNESSRRVGLTVIEPIDTLNRHQQGMQSFGYLLHGPDEVIAYSGDLADPQLISSELRRRGITSARVFHDIAFIEKVRHAHAYYKDVAQNAGNWTLRGYHNNPAAKPADCDIVLAYEDPDCAPLPR